ncbi:hypothetical protein Dimus_003439, partial [Dionaea muscipula]
MTDLGTHVSQNVGINIDSWWHVSKETKVVIWGLLENTYVIGVDHKKNIRSWEATRFKEFKSKSTREYVLPLIDGSPELQLIFSPRILKNHDTRVLDKFYRIQTRSDKFLEKRRKNVQNRKKHDHRLGRKGYVRMVDDL